MKTLVAVTWLSITLAFCVLAISAQDKPRKTVTVETVKPFDLNEYRDWKKVEFKGFSIYVPKEFELKEFRGVDGGGWRHESPDLRFIITSGFISDAPLTSDQKRPYYKEKFVRIGNISVRLWFYKDETPPDKFANSPYFGTIAFSDQVTKATKHAIWLWSKESKGLDLLEKMLGSIQFK